MRVTLLHNPNAGRGKVTAADLQDLLREAGHEVTYVSMKSDYAAALRAPGDLIAVAGGDGTVEKIGRRMAGVGVPLAILPLGTANNIANALGVDGSLREIVNGWKTARRRPFDVGIAKGPWGKRRFLEAVGFGAIPLAIKAFERERDEQASSGGSVGKELDDASRTMQETIDTHPAQPYEILLDGRDVSGSYVFVAVMNIRALGPQIDVAPEADPSDGQFHLVLIDDEHRGELRAAASPVGAHLAGTSGLNFPLGRDVRITSTGAPLHIDDEVWPEKDEDLASLGKVTAEIRMEPRALEILVSR